MKPPERQENLAARVLLVDDERTFFHIFAALLSDLGHSVTATSDPDVALECAAREKFDIAFLDQCLGSIRGIDLMQRLAVQDQNLYFVIMTGNGNAELAAESLRNGASDFLTKPFFQDDVIRAIGFVNRKRDLDQRQRSMVAELEQRVREKTKEVIELNFSVLTALARAVEKKDLGTYGHSMRVSAYAGRIAERIKLPAEERHHLRAAALLHDIGKIGISDSILGKSGPLSSAEREEIRRHPENGVEILKPLKHYLPILSAILHHHEHYDGKGYPSAIRGEKIPLHARIISVADTYDAVLSDRPYRDAAEQACAFAVLRAGSGKQFDPGVVDAFLNGVADDDRLFPPQTSQGFRSGAGFPGCNDGIIISSADNGLQDNGSRCDETTVL
jgi:putative nucleotidyltransferase with HDIG domain